MPNIYFNHSNLLNRKKVFKKKRRNRNAFIIYSGNNN